MPSTPAPQPELPGPHSEAGARTVGLSRAQRKTPSTAKTVLGRPKTKKKKKKMGIPGQRSPGNEKKIPADPRRLRRAFPAHL